MIVDQEVCSGCGSCAPFCPVRAIQVDGVASIDRDLCVECGACERMDACPEGAFHMEETLPWPRSIRAILSNPLTCFKETGVTGRGTEEMKTNDLSNRYVSGMVGVALDVGRPNVSTSLRDVERIAKAVAAAGVQFEAKNPITYLMTDTTTGAMDPEVLNERVMSAVVEFTASLDEIPRIVKASPGSRVPDRYRIHLRYHLPGRGGQLYTGDPVAGEGRTDPWRWSQGERWAGSAVERLSEFRRCRSALGPGQARCTGGKLPSSPQGRGWDD